ncbi:MAG: hypothetical protein JNL98_31760 [Bryobacterales bacterium]|nr:hypothetical protein [Bryobacterales bacterium]
MLKLRTGRFAGRCSRHKRFNPAIDGRGAIKGGCPRCEMLFEIWETSLKLNGLIRRFGALKEDDASEKPHPLHDRRQMSLLDCLM